MTCISVNPFFFSYLEVHLLGLSVTLAAFCFPVLETCIFTESHLAAGIINLCFAFLLENAKSRLMEIS